jgi:diguanylate cyclase (GGDEF)-like protein
MDVRTEVRATNRAGSAAVLRQLGPFALTAVVAWVAILIGTHIDWREYWISLALLAGSWTYGVVTGLRGHMLTGTVLGSFGFLLALALARDSAGGSTSSIGIVSLLPVFQTALYVRDRLGLALVLSGVTAFYLGPLIFIGPPAYPATGYRGALLAVAVSSIVGFVTQQLVADIRRRAAESRHRERILVRVSETVRGLYESADPRHDACQAAVEISDALVVALYEPEPLTGRLLVTTSTAIPDAIATGAEPRSDSAVYAAFNSGQRRLICDDVEASLGNLDLWRLAGEPRSLLYEPLLKGDHVVGVLAVGWKERVDVTHARVVVASLLAHEIAAVIDRADVIVQLTDEALTDPLTELPNRRAWDAALAQAMRGDREPVAVAMLDIDRFKQFNDSHGHPAGDRLLREAAAAWRSEVRAGDFLARLGGEEFALLLTGRDVDAVQAAVERLRNRMPAHQTCSAGIAVRVEGDTPELLLSRADQALYEAKTAGRDRAVFAGVA